MLSRGPDIETEPYYCLPVSGSVAWSQPTSPSPRGLTGLLSPTLTNHRLVYQKKTDEGKLDLELLASMLTKNVLLLIQLMGVKSR